MHAWLRFRKGLGQSFDHIVMPSGDTANGMAARKLIAAKARPRVDKLADPAIALRDCV